MEDQRKRNMTERQNLKKHDGKRMTKQDKLVNRETERKRNREREREIRGREERKIDVLMEVGRQWAEGRGNREVSVVRARLR